MGQVPLSCSTTTLVVLVFPWLAVFASESVVAVGGRSAHAEHAEHAALGRRALQETASEEPAPLDDGRGACTAACRAVQFGALSVVGLCLLVMKLQIAKKSRLADAAAKETADCSEAADEEALD